MSFDLGTVIKGVAPMLATALLGPFGGIAAKAIAGAVLPDAPADDAAPESVKDSIIKAIQDGTANMAGLKKAEDDFKLRMAELGYKNAADLEKIAADDRASARHLQEVTRSPMPAVLAVLVTFGFFGVLGYLLVAGKPAQGGDALLVMLGSLGTAWTAIVSFYFGSSSGSQQKDAMMGKLAAR
jgi:hypothetical protein